MANAIERARDKDAAAVADARIEATKNAPAPTRRQFSPWYARLLEQGRSGKQRRR